MDDKDLLGKKWKDIFLKENSKRQVPNSPKSEEEKEEEKIKEEEDDDDALSKLSSRVNSGLSLNELAEQFEKEEKINKETKKRDISDDKNTQNKKLKPSIIKGYSLFDKRESEQLIKNLKQKQSEQLIKDLKQDGGYKYNKKGTRTMKLGKKSKKTKSKKMKKTLKTHYRKFMRERKRT